MSILQVDVIKKLQLNLPKNLQTSKRSTRMMMMRLVSLRPNIGRSNVRIPKTTKTKIMPGKEQRYKIPMQIKINK